MASSPRRIALLLVALVGLGAVAPSTSLAVSSPAPKLTVSTKSLPVGFVAEKYTTTLAAKHSHGADRWTASGLPAGLSISHKGVLSGVPKKAGHFTVTVKVVDAKADRASRKLKLVIRNPATAISVGNTGGQTFACALTKVGAVQCWGQDDSDEVGKAGPQPVTAPHTVAGFSAGATSVSAGSQFACAVSKAGAAKCWGRDTFGELGDGVSNYSKIRANPVTVTGLGSGVRAVYAAKDFALGCALMTSGSVKCWGNNEDGALGTNTSAVVSPTPVTIAGLPSNVTSVAVGSSFICALTRSGAVWCWGANTLHQLGNGSSAASSATPVEPTGLTSDVRSLAVGGEGGCAVTGTGALRCWGDASNGASSNTPIAVPGMPGGQATVAVGSNGTTCTLSTTGAARCFGYNYDGQLGNGDSTGTTSNTPVRVKGISSGAKALSVATYTGCALISGGSIKCWGYVQTESDNAYAPVALPWYF